MYFKENKPDMSGSKPNMSDYSPGIWILATLNGMFHCRSGYMSLYSHRTHIWTYLFHVLSGDIHSLEVCGS